MKVEPYLLFEGSCDKAIEFHRTANGAELEMLMRYKEAPEPPPGMGPPGWDDKVMRASLRIGETRVMASDDCAPRSKAGCFSLSITASDSAQGERLFKALADGGKVTMPFGMLTDRFGIGWMVNCEA